MNHHHSRGMIFGPRNAYRSSIGLKTETRRILKQQPKLIPNGKYKTWVWPEDGRACNLAWVDGLDPNIEDATSRFAPYQPGSIVYIKEQFGDGPSAPFLRDIRWWLRSDGWRDGRTPADVDRLVTKWRSPMFMPRHRATTWLRIDGVRLERVQDITESGAAAEGCDGDCPIGYIPAYEAGPLVYHFARNWDEINGGDAWERNDWVWVYKYRTLNPDELAAVHTELAASAAGESVAE